MVVCRFFLQGNCRYGQNCKFEHPQSGGGLANQNRFGALSGGGGGGRFGGGNSSNIRQSRRINASDVVNDLSDRKERPKWILSSYAPGKELPASLLEANEYSPEEVRVRFYELQSQGKGAEADNEAIALWKKAEQDMIQIFNSADDVNKFMEDAARKHPNRDDMTKMDGTKSRDDFLKDSAGGAPSTGFGQTSTPSPFAKPAASSFGQPSQPSVFGASSSFGKPAFGQSGFGSNAGQTATPSPFGQPSTGGAFGQPAFGSTGFGQSTFGQPSQPTSAFGQPSQPTSTFGLPSQPMSSFGQPSLGSSGFGSNAQKNPLAPASAASGFGQGSSAFGQPSQPTSTFGQPSQPTSTFGQPNQPASTFGQPSQPSSMFGQPSQPTSTFGQPSQPSSTFGQPSQPSSTFGQPSQPTSTFGQPTQPSTFGQPTQPSSTFGRPSAFGQPSTSFGQPSQPASTFGQASPFGQAANTAGTFGQPSTQASPFGVKPAEVQPNDQAMETMSPAGSRPVSRANPFGSAATQSTAQPATPKPIINTSSTPHPLTGRPPHAMHYTQSLPLQPTQKDASGEVTSYRGQRVQYFEGTPCYNRPDGGGWEKIWFPDAGASPEVVALNREDKIEDTQGAEAEYTDRIKEQYKYLFEEGRFKMGLMPLIPPMREWSVYDF